ncbi:TPA: agmatinase, partial [Candidatus Micrarchaeota archaeon]|nr:agmatinase [Candidatus Micrarchaeota archaeon]
LRALDVDTVVYVDAHWDMREEYMGERYSHACVARRLVEEGKKLIFLGVRSGSKEEWERGRRHVWCGREGWPEVEGKVYITIDVDAFDPAFAPGVGTPEPGGVDPGTFFAWLRRIPAEVVGADVVETNPLIEGWITPALAAKIVRELAAKMIAGP